jgi:hypothetical protein
MPELISSCLKDTSTGHVLKECNIFEINVSYKNALKTRLWTSYSRQIIHVLPKLLSTLGMTEICRMKLEDCGMNKIRLLKLDQDQSRASFQARPFDRFCGAFTSLLKTLCK